MGIESHVTGTPHRADPLRMRSNQNTVRRTARRQALLGALRTGVGSIFFDSERADPMGNSSGSYPDETSGNSKPARLGR